jgi:hypothetical protein
MVRLGSRWTLKLPIARRWGAVRGWKDNSSSKVVLRRCQIYRHNFLRISALRSLMTWSYLYRELLPNLILLRRPFFPWWDVRIWHLLVIGGRWLEVTQGLMFKRLRIIRMTPYTAATNTRLLHALPRYLKSSFCCRKLPATRPCTLLLCLLLLCSLRI